MLCHLLFIVTLVVVTPFQTNIGAIQPSSPTELLLKWLQVNNHKDASRFNKSELTAFLQRGEVVYLDGGFESTVSMFGSLVLDLSLQKPCHDPVCDNILYYLSGALIKTGSFGWARQILTRLINRTPRSAFRMPAFRKLTDLALQSGQYQALTEFMAALPKDLSPEELDELTYLEGKMLADLGFSEPAQKSLLSASKASRFYGAAQYLLGAIALEQGRTQEAAERFCTVVDGKSSGNWSSTDRTRTAFFISEKTPEIIDHAWMALGRIRHDKGLYAYSVNAYRNIGPGSPLYNQARYESAWSLLRMGRNFLVRDIIEKLLTQNRSLPDWPNARLLLGRAFLSDCLFDQAMREFSSLENTLEIVSLSSRAQSAIPFTKHELQVSKLDRKAVNLLQRSMLMRSFLSNLLHSSETYPYENQTIRLINKLESNLNETKRLKDMLVALEPKWVLDNLGDIKEIKQLDSQVARIMKKTEQSVSTLYTLLSSQVVTESYPASKSDSPNRYLNAEERNISMLIRRLAICRQSTRRLQKLAGTIHLNRTADKMASWIRAARIGKIDTVLGRKQARETEIQNLAYGQYPLSVLQDLVKSGMLDETMEYWPYDSEDWPDENQ